MQLEENKLYISFHKPKNILGHLITLWTLGKYSHCEFIFNNKVYLANVGGGVREQEFKALDNIDVFELDSHILPEDILEFYKEVKGKGYDYGGILGSQFLWFLNAQDKDKYFCSEFCLNAIDYALQFSLTYKGKTLEKKGYHKFSPVRLHKYLKNMELLGSEVQ